MGKLYVVEALRWNDREKHSYVVGVFSTKERAELASDTEYTVRAGKYTCAITEHELDFIDEGDIAFATMCMG